VELNIRITGAAGQGMATSTDILGRLAARHGLHCYMYSDAESRIRGGCNFNHLRISNTGVSAPVDKIDILIALNDESYTLQKSSLVNKGIVIGMNFQVLDNKQYIDLTPFVGKNLKSVGTSSISIVATFLGIEIESIKDIIKEKFGKNKKILEGNIEVVETSVKFAENFFPGEKFKFPKVENKKLRFMSGADSLSLGTVAGGVSFMAAYPMSPATSIMTNLANWADYLDIHVEQAEDEISAINMVAGAAFGGARSLTATSGGGFALMTEGLSLLGMIETPGVIIIAQRPGPATGLPTRTAQGDLRFAIHGGHGFFPKIILAPRSIEHNFEIGAKSFDLAEKYQIPVIVLTDQQLQDSKETVTAFDTDSIENKSYLLDSKSLNEIEEYKRYKITDDGISPMAVPGLSRHTVVVDSDEHDEDGHMTESGEIADQMAQKRFRKLDTIISQMDMPLVNGSGTTVVLTWGSTFEVVKEAQGFLESKGKKFKHIQFDWLWPLSKEKLDPLFEGVDRLIIVEHSTWPEFESLVNEIMLRKVDYSIRKFNGRPFELTEVIKELEEVL
jgi:2-oxoglutarate/2-oxoacid ferredoxin oxidoreductase subunit alpha